MVNKREIADANKRGSERQDKTPTAVKAWYDHDLRKVVVDLSSGLSIMFKPKDAQELQRAAPAQLDKIEITPSGFGLHFPSIDADIYLPGLLEGYLGSRHWMAAQLGKAGGRVKTRAKAAASRKNGKLGGRPRKSHGPADARR